MPSSPVGQATCPECGHSETVLSDGRKFYIKCTAADCRALTNYQAKPAKTRIQNRLQGGPKPEPQPVKQPDSPPPATPDNKPEKNEPAADKNSGFLDALENLF